jgi:uncharacterized protein YkwD
MKKLALFGIIAGAIVLGMAIVIFGSLLIVHYSEALNSTVNETNASLPAEPPKNEDSLNSQNSPDLNKEEQNLLDEINQKRQSGSLESLDRSSAMDSVADSLAGDFISGRITEEEVFSIESLDKLLTAQGVFFTYSQMIWYNYALNSTKDISLKMFDFFMSDDSIKREVLSKEYSNLGIGSYCSGDKTPGCLTLLVLTKDHFLFNESLKRDYLKLYDLYYRLPSSMASLEKTVTITFNSSKPAVVYLIKSPDDYKKLLSRNNIDELFKESSSSFTKTVLIKPGYSIVVSAANNDIDYQLRIE